MGSPSPCPPPRDPPIAARQRAGAGEAVGNLEVRKVSGSALLCRASPRSDHALAQELSMACWDTTWQAQCPCLAFKDSTGMESHCFQRPSSEVCWVLPALGFHPLPQGEEVFGPQQPIGARGKVCARVHLVMSPTPRHRALAPPPTLLLLPHPYLSLGSPNLLCLTELLLLTVRTHRGTRRGLPGSKDSG